MSKDLDEWLMGSGESAETTDSKLNNTRKMLEKPVQPSSQCINEQNEDEDSDVPEAEEDSDDLNEDWMFKTFSQNKKKTKKKQPENKSAFDPFSAVQKVEIKDHITEEGDVSLSSDEDDYDPKCDDSDDDGMLGGGLQLMAQGRSSSRDCVKQVATECVDLNQFISKMDELVSQQYHKN